MYSFGVCVKRKANGSVCLFCIAKHKKMVLTFLGTAAAEGLPAVWCNCQTCRNARQAGGKEVRTRSQILIDDCVLVDFPMDTYTHALTHKLDLSRIDAVLITHAHMDHCYPQEFVLHGEPYAHDMKKSVLTVYGNPTVRNTFYAQTKAEMRPYIAQSVPFSVMHPYESVITASGYRVTAFPAKHTVGEECLIYAVEKDGTTALLFNDSGILPDEVYNNMAKAGMRFDLVSFDCTYGHARHGEGRHMGAHDAADEREKMKAHCLVHEQTRYILTHFSHNGNISHEELSRLEKENNFTVAYDGMTMEIKNV